MINRWRGSAKLAEAYFVARVHQALKCSHNLKSLHARRLHPNEWTRLGYGSLLPGPWLISPSHPLCPTLRGCTYRIVSSRSHEKGPLVKFALPMQHFLNIYPANAASTAAQNLNAKPERFQKYYIFNFSVYFGETEI